MIIVLVLSVVAACFFVAALACWMQSKTRNWRNDQVADMRRSIGFVVAGALSLIFGIALGLVTYGVIQ